MAEPQHVVPVRLYEDGNEIDPMMKAGAAIPEGGPKTIQDYYREVSQGVTPIDLATGQEYVPDADVPEGTGQAESEPNPAPVNTQPAVAPPKPPVQMKQKAPVAKGDLADASGQES